MTWFHAHKRHTPWRQNRSPYFVWVSEVMLQQTTTQAAIPFFKRFIQKFPTLEDLAQAPLEEVLEAWAGLGYYNRAKNLHKSAQMFQSEKNIPQTHKELLDFPGFGLYTSRSLASIAFDASVGVVDGNIIRVFSRLFDLDTRWWSSAGRALFQSLADEAVQGFSSRDINEALMELGSSLCCPKNPFCLTCPLSSDCLALRRGSIALRPLSRKKSKNHTLIWKPLIFKDSQGSFALVPSSYLPFLKQSWLFPGKLEAVSKKPKSFHFAHTITKYKIFVILSNPVHNGIDSLKLKDKKHLKWVPVKEIKKWNPSSLLTKSLEHFSQLS